MSVAYQAELGSLLLNTKEADIEWATLMHQGSSFRRVLSIDGGGIRGIIPAMVVAHIEKRMGEPAHKLFDLMVGTSTGGILALGLSRPGSGRQAQFSARRVVKLYEEQGDKIFEYSLWRKLRTVGGILEEAYSHEVLEGILGKYFAGATLGDCEVPTMVTSYDIQNRRTVFLKSWHADHQSLLCRDAARATSAAPTYFEPKPLDTGDAASVLIDGGIFMNSPRCPLMPRRASFSRRTLSQSCPWGPAN